VNVNAVATIAILSRLADPDIMCTAVVSGFGFLQFNNMYCQLLLYLSIVIRKC
jgi:hypothetical protein